DRARPWTRRYGSGRSPKRSRSPDAVPDDGRCAASREEDAVNVLEAVQNVTRAWLQARGVRSRTERMADHEVHHYVLEGTGGGPPVFLVHGLGGSENGYAAILFGLARRFRRIHALDMPGHGLSPEPAVPLTLRAQMDLLHAYARRELPQPALVVGNSLGGALSIQLAAEAPEHVGAGTSTTPAAGPPVRARARPRGWRGGGRWGGPREEGARHPRHDPAAERAPGRAPRVRTGAAGGGVPQPLHPRLLHPCATWT